VHYCISPATMGGLREALDVDDWSVRWRRIEHSTVND
jgi:hypothetical protein